MLTLRCPGHTLYSNAVGSCGAVFPPGPGSRIQAELSDTHFVAFVLAGRLALVCVYLPDSGKTDHAYQEAMEQLAGALDALRRLHSITRFMVVGDFNCELAHCNVLDHAAPGEVFGPLLPLRVSRRFAERQDMVAHLCSRFDLVHGPSWIENAASVVEWTRRGWGPAGTCSALDFCLVSNCMQLVRWTPWPAEQWEQERERVWADHRPVLWTLAPRMGQPRFSLPTPSGIRSYAGFQLDVPADSAQVQRELHDWARGLWRMVAPEGRSDALPGWGELSRKILACCTAVPFSTAASRRSVAAHPPALLRQVRADRRALPAGSHALLANRRLERALVRQHATRKFKASGGLRQQRFRDGWRTISYLTFSAGGAPTCNRDVWRAD